MANVIVSFTPAQFQWVQTLVNRKVQEEGTAHPSNSGNLSNNPTMQQGDLTVAQSVLAALQTAGQ